MARKLPPAGSWFRILTELALYLSDVPVGNDKYSLDGEGARNLLTLFYNSFDVGEDLGASEEAVEEKFVRKKNIFRFILGGRNSNFLKAIADFLIAREVLPAQISIVEDYHRIIIALLRELEKDPDFLADVKASIPAFLKLGYLEFISEFGAGSRKYSRQYLGSDVVTITVATIGFIFTFVGGLYQNIIVDPRDVYQYIVPSQAKDWLNTVKKSVAPLFRSRELQPTESLISLMITMASFESHTRVSNLIRSMGIPVYHVSIACTKNRCNMVNMQNLALREPLDIMFSRRIDSSVVKEARISMQKLYSAATLGEDLSVRPDKRQQMKQYIYDSLIEYSQRFILYSMTGNRQIAYLAMRRLSEMGAVLRDANVKISDIPAEDLVKDVLNFMVEVL